MQPDPIHLNAVRRWAIRDGITRSKFLESYRRSYCLSVSRLVQALYREHLCEMRIVEHASLGTCMTLGSPASLLVPIVPLPFVRMEVRVWPPCYRQRGTPLRWSGTFLRELRGLLKHPAMSLHQEELSFDFKNSLSNLTLNFLLGSRPQVARHALEPAYQGHHYYPFPGLRVGPSIDHVVACSHLNTRNVSLSLLEVSVLDFRSTMFSNARDCFAAWSGVQVKESEHAIPVHPWQIEISPVVAGLISARGARLLGRKLACMPLASQRTLRVRRTGYDIKLSVDAALTSEHRLLYRLNCKNAPVVSALVETLLRSEGTELALDIQADIASLSFGDSRLAPHLSAIVRAPIRLGSHREHALPAIELWTGRELAKDFLRGSKPTGVTRFFRDYCQVLMRGPFCFLMRYGLAFEPHLQNSVIVFRGRKPARLILRDLDGTLMERKRVLPLLKEFNLQLADDTWDHMPSPEVGESRWVHSVMFGHLGVVIDFLVLHCGARQDELLRALVEVWRRLPETPNLKGVKKRMGIIAEQMEKGKSMLMGRLERSSRMRFVELPIHPIFDDESRRLPARRN
jgi:siderophore synthetase component